MGINLRIVLMVIMCIVGAILLIAINPRLSHLYYYFVEIPEIKHEVDRIPGVKLGEIKDVGPDDETNVYISILVKGKGNLSLYRLTRSSFSGGGPIIISAIGDCEILFINVERQASRHAYLAFDTVLDVILNYDLIVEFVRKEELCTRWRNTPSNY